MVGYHSERRGNTEPHSQKSEKTKGSGVFSNFITPKRLPTPLSFSLVDLEPSVLDLDAEAGAALKHSLNIDPDYFTDIPEDPAPERLEAVRRELHELARTGGQDP